MKKIVRRASHLDSDSRLPEDGDEDPGQVVPLLGWAGVGGGIASVLSVIYFLRLYKMFYLFFLLPPPPPTPPLVPAKQIACASAKRAAMRVWKCEKRILGVHLYIHTHTILYIHICIPILYIILVHCAADCKANAVPSARVMRPNEPMNYFLPSSKFQGSSSSSTETDVVVVVLRKLRKRKVLSICNGRTTTITPKKVTAEQAWRWDTLRLFLKT